MRDINKTEIKFLEVKTKMCKMKNTQDDSSIELILLKNISDLEDIAIKTTQNKSGEKRIKNNEQSISELWHNFRQYNIHIILVSEQKRGRISIQRNNGEKCPNLIKPLNPQIQKSSKKPKHNKHEETILI